MLDYCRPYFYLKGRRTIIRNKNRSEVQIRYVWNLGRGGWCVTRCTLAHIFLCFIGLSKQTPMVEAFWRAKNKGHQLQIFLPWKKKIIFWLRNNLVYLNFSYLIEKKNNNDHWIRSVRMYGLCFINNSSRLSLWLLCITIKKYCIQNTS